MIVVQLTKRMLLRRNTSKLTKIKNDFGEFRR